MVILLNNDKQTYRCYLCHNEYKMLKNNGVFEIFEVFQCEFTLTSKNAHKNGLCAAKICNGKPICEIL